jgi:K+-sensing histidine kinase KdpD
MLGFPDRETLLATNVASQYVDPKACEQWQARMVREGKIFESEVQWRRYDGTIIWVQESAQATFADDGHMLYYEGAVRDITERKRTQEEQRRHTQGLITLNAVATGISQARTLYDILNTTLDAVLKLARKEQGTIHLFKEQGDALMLATHCGLSDALLAEIEKTTTLKDKDLVALALEAGSATALATETKTEVEPAEESQQLTVAVPLKSAARVAGVLCLFGDNGRGLDAQNLQLLTAIGDMVGVAIENQRLVEQMTQIQAWRETDRLRTELIANVSHELRTPLGLIKLFGTALLDQETRLDPATRRQFLQDINEEADKLAQIVSNLLATAHQQNAPVRLNKRATDLARLVKEVMKSMEIQLLRHRFVYTGTDAPLDILIDPQATEQVLRNLLSNAIKYSPSGGTITVHLARESSRALIRVADEGIGIPQADLERIFERFYRVQNDLTQTVSGVGLGLPLARGIVEAHGGRIWAESTLGAGSRFFVSLPGNGEPTN